jgi:predicted MPP superfamily phosphohydrolase
MRLAPARRTTLAISTALALASAAALGLYAEAETRRLVVERPVIQVRLPLRRPARLRVLHLCDLHLRGWNPLCDLLVERIGQLQYDLALISGDLADNDVGRAAAMEVLRTLRAPLGQFAVPGNHDRRRYSFRDTIRSTINELRGGPISAGADFHFETFGRQIQGAGVQLLCNEGARLDLPEGELWLLGLDDEHSGYDDLDAALRAAPAGAARIMFTHCPDAFPAVARAGVPLLLAGHTHGGQIVLPFIGAPQTRSQLRLRHPSGLFRAGQSQLYINRGAGGSIPLRLSCRPELALIDLRIEPS